jgi:molybdopterin-guanine dinucleotide biosynthesis protein A
MTVVGYVQAGGGSTRFGGDKALSQFQGKTMLARTVELVAFTCGNVRIVAAARKYPGAPAPVVKDRWPGEGPLGGILTALWESKSRGSGADWNLIVSCDMPFLTQEWLEFLCERASRSAAQVVVPQSASGLEPLCACWRTDSAAAVQAGFDSGVRKVAEAMKRLSMEVLDEAVWKRFDTDGRLFWNMNTPADYEEARRILEARER